MTPASSLLQQAQNMQITPECPANSGFPSLHPRACLTPFLKASTARGRSGRPQHSRPRLGRLLRNQSQHTYSVSRIRCFGQGNGRKLGDHREMMLQRGVVFMSLHRAFRVHEVLSLWFLPFLWCFQLQ